MVAAVIGDFVAGRLNAAHELWIAFGDPAQHEERRPHLKAFEQRQNPVRANLDALFLAIPVVLRNAIGKSGDVKVVFDINRESVHHVALSKTAPLNLAWLVFRTASFMLLEPTWRSSGRSA